MSASTGHSKGMRWQGCGLQFLPERALWLEEEGLLLIADANQCIAGNFATNLCLDPIE